MNSMIDSYKIWYLGGDPEVEAVIECFHGQDKVGVIQFLKDGLPIPPNVVGPHGMNFYYPRDHFNNISTILRHEEPLYMSLNSNGEGWVATIDREPVGESE